MADKKIEIFYRDMYYHPEYKESNKNRPKWFERSNIWRNFRRTLDFSIINFNYILDYPFDDELQKPFEFKIHQIRAGTDQSAFFELMKILEKTDFKPNQIIYIVENDYLHRPGWCEILLEGFEHGDYVTLYDHPDKYTDYTDLQSKIFVTKSCHWRTIPSTTNTFAVKYSILMEDMELHKYYAEFGIQGLAHDHTKFLDLGKKGRKIISSIPGYSTHCNNYLSPCTDWQKIIKK